MEKAIKGTAEGGSKASSTHQLGEDETKQSECHNRRNGKGREPFCLRLLYANRKDRRGAKQCLAAGLERGGFTLTFYHKLK